VLRVLLASLVPAIQVLELDQQHGRLHGIQAEVPADNAVQVSLLSAVVAEEPQALGQGLIVGDHHAAVAYSPEVLGRVEAEAAHHAHAARRANIPIDRADRLGGVLDNGDPYMPAELQDAPMLAHWPKRWIGMTAFTRRWSVGSSPAHAFSRPSGLMLDLTGSMPTKHGDRTQAHRHAGRREEGVRRPEDPVPGVHAEGHQGRQERVRSGGHPDAVPHSDVVRDRLLEGCHLGSQGELLALQDAVDGLAYLLSDRGVLRLEIGRRDAHPERSHRVRMDRVEARNAFMALRVSTIRGAWAAMAA
jgi:hypothetical protein